LFPVWSTTRREAGGWQSPHHLIFTVLFSPKAPARQVEV